ncbi:MAG: ParB/RepB/Spo0J family partition protein [Synergistaceae bacterium]|nr:ParB/RepB/Spo0J family partition protein [Synergistaceae bacterium]
MAGVLDFLRSERRTEKADLPLPSEGKGERLIHIPLELIRPNPAQPRLYFDEEELRELAASIAEVGVIQPVIVLSVESGYELVVGERRLRASKIAGMKTIPAIVTESAPAEQQMMALMENIHRSNLSPLEEAASFRDILERSGWNQSELAEKLGRSQPSIANKLRLLKLDESVQILLLEGKLSERQARALLSLPPDEQAALAFSAVEENLAVKELEQRVKEGTLPSSKVPKRKKKSSPLSFTGPDGPTGEILRDVADVVERNRKKGISVMWKVKELAQRQLVVELVVDLKGQMDESDRKG